MLRPSPAAARGSRLDALGTIFAVSLIVGSLMVSAPGTSALFTADYPAVLTVHAGQIFPDERVSAPFKVSDHSSGSATDASSPVAFAGDGQAMTTSAWPASFATDHYVELRFNDPLPGNVALSAASFDLSWASASGTVCVYFDARDSGGGLLNSEGNAGSPLSCTSSSSPVGLVTPLPGVGTTDDANGATVRMFVSSSAAAATILDQAVLKVTYGSEQYTLYPVDVVDAADGSPSTDHWGLAGP